MDPSKIFFILFYFIYFILFYFFYLFSGWRENFFFQKRLEFIIDQQIYDRIKFFPKKKPFMY